MEIGKWKYDVAKKRIVSMTKMITAFNKVSHCWLFFALSNLEKQSCACGFLQVNVEGTLCFP